MAVAWFDGVVVAGQGALLEGMVTFLLTDVEESTRLWEQAPAAMADAVRRHYAVLAELISSHNGVRPIEQGEGDSVVAAFGSAVDATRCAVAIQSAFAAEAWPQEATLCVRVGLHTGEAELRDDANYMGRAILRTARIRGLAFGGQTLLSAATATLVRDQLPEGCALVDRGMHALKGLRDPEQVWELVRPGQPAFASVREEAFDAAPLPTPITPFIGRTRDVANLREVLRTDRLITLNGVGGSGKTRLAIEVARGAMTEFDRVHFVELATVGDEASLGGAIAAQLALSTVATDVADALVGALAGRRLLVLDNCEQVLTAVASLAASLLSRLPELTVLATSREPLGLAGETSWRVVSLDDRDSLRLFVDRATRARGSSLEYGEEQLEIVEQICRRLDGIPLAIELAAARAASLPLARLADGLHDRFRLLTGGARGAVPRQQTLQASVDWSFDLLTNTERTAFRRLGVFNGGFTLDAAEAVVPDESLVVTDVLPAVMALVDKSLVTLDDDGRYQMLETLRQYATARLIDAGEMPSTRDRHLSWVRSLAPAFTLFADDPEWVPPETVAIELPNLAAAFDWATDPRDVAHLGARLIRAQVENSGARIALAAAERLRTVDKAAVTPDLYAVAVAARVMAAVEIDGRLDDDVVALLDEAASAVRDPRSAFTAYAMSVFPRGLNADIAALLAVADATRSPGRMAYANGLVAALSATGGRFEDTLAALARIAVLEEAGRLPMRAMYRANAAMARANVALALGDGEHVGDRAGAVEYTWRRNPRLEFLQFMHHVAASLYLDESTGDEAHIEVLLERARAAGYTVADQRAFIVAAWKMARLDVAGGARELIDEFSQRAGRFPVGAVGMQALLGLPVIHAYVSVGDLAGAREAVRLIRRHVEEAQSQLGPFVDQSEALVALVAGELKEAEQLTHAALAVASERGLRPTVALCLERLAVVAHRHEAIAEAARFLGAARAVRTQTRFALVWPDERALLDEVAADLDEGAFVSGQALSISEAVAFARRSRVERKRPTVGLAALTSTERRVAQLAAAGLTNKQIGAELLMGSETVKTHLGRVFTKLSLRRRTELKGVLPPAV